MTQSGHSVLRIVATQNVREQRSSIGSAGCAASFWRPMLVTKSQLDELEVRGDP